ncbi:TolC family protein [soil metagenome]
MTRTILFFSIILISTSARAQQADDVVATVLRANPQLEAARLRWEAMKERPRIAGSLPDPMLTYGYFFENVETRVGAQNQRIGASQRIPFPGKLSLAAKRARQEALQSFWQYQTLARELIMRTKVAYYELRRVDETRRILREQVELFGQAIESARVRYEAGTVEQQDVLKAQLASAEIEKRLLELTQMRAAAQARLNALRDAPAGAAVSTAAGLQVPAVPALDRARALAAQYRQELHEANVTIERNETALALARRERLPDFTVGVDYTQVNRNIFANPPDNGQDAVVGSISVNVPIWFGKLNALEREARNDLAASELSARHVSNTVDADVRDAWFQATTARDQVALYRENLLPQARQTLESSRASYEAGKGSFIDFLDTERSLLNFRLGVIASETDLAKALAMLERAVGVDLRRASSIPLQRTKERSK